MDPENLFKPSQPQGPPTPPSQPQMPSLDPHPDKEQYGVSDGRKKKMLILGGGLVILLAVSAIAAVLLSPNSKKNNQQTEQQSTQSTGIIKEPSAVDIESVNNSVSSDITGLDDAKDFPETSLSDKELEL